MSIRISLDNFSMKDRNKLIKDLVIYGEETKYGTPSLEIYSVEGNDVLLPFSYFYHFWSDKIKNGKNANTDPIEYPKTTSELMITLRPYQNAIKKEVYDILNRTRSIFLACNCAFGKTYFALYLAIKLGYKTAIEIHIKTLETQWKQSIETISPNSKIQIIKGKDEVDPDADFYIINVKTCINRTGKRFHREFKDVGILICDEAHAIYSEKRAKSLFKFEPKYLIGLSATPFRKGGISSLLGYYFGPEMIFRELFRPFNAYTYFTDFVPKVEKNKRGGIDWNSVLDSISENEDIQDLIVSIIRFFSNRNILVLTKRVEKEGVILYNKLQEILKNNNEDPSEVELFVGNSKKYNYDCRVLISTCSKSGVGFDNTRLDMLLLASDVEEGIEQYMGRVFRKEDTIPIIVDIVHYKFRPLYNHWETRKNLYTRCGGVIKDLGTYFPEFETI